MRKRTPSEIKAYGDGYIEAYKEFCHLLDRHEKDTAIRKMKIFADAVALTVETATDTADTPQTESQIETQNSNVISVYDGVSEAVRCAMCSNPNKSDRGCDGACSYDEKLYKRIMDAIDESRVDTPQTESTGSPIGNYRDGVGAWQTDCGWGEPNED